VDVQITMEGQNHQAYLWQYADREAAWCSNSAWGGGATDPRSSWDNSKAFLQTDGYVAYDGVGRAEDRACLLLGARAKEVLSRQPSSTPTISLHGHVALIDGLFGIDAQARELNLDHRRTPCAWRLGAGQAIAGDHPR